jgi:hypothetical protein
MNHQGKSCDIIAEGFANMRDSFNTPQFQESCRL